MAAGTNVKAPFEASVAVPQAAAGVDVNAYANGPVPTAAGTVAFTVALASVVATSAVAAGTTMFEVMVTLEAPVTWLSGVLMVAVLVMGPDAVGRRTGTVSGGKVPPGAIADPGVYRQVAVVDPMTVEEQSQPVPVGSDATTAPFARLSVIVTGCASGPQAGSLDPVKM